MSTWPSLWTKKLGTPNDPAIRFTRGTDFVATMVRNCYGLSGCSPPWTDLTVKHFGHRGRPAALFAKPKSVCPAHSTRNFLLLQRSRLLSMSFQPIAAGIVAVRKAG